MQQGLRDKMHAYSKNIINLRQNGYNPFITFFLVDICLTGVLTFLTFYRAIYRSLGKFELSMVYYGHNVFTSFNKSLVMLLKSRADGSFRLILIHYDSYAYFFTILMIWISRITFRQDMWLELRNKDIKFVSKSLVPQAFYLFPFYSRWCCFLDI